MVPNAPQALHVGHVLRDNLRLPLPSDADAAAETRIIDRLSAHEAPLHLVVEDRPVFAFGTFHTRCSIASSGVRDCSCSQERLPEPPEHRQVGVKPDALQSASAKRRRA